MATTKTTRPTPVIDYARLGALVSAVVTAGGGCLVIVGLATDGAVQVWSASAGAVVVAVGALLAYVLPIVQAKKATELVTPVEDPHTVDAATGHLVPLVPATVDIGPDNGAAATAGDLGH